MYMKILGTRHKLPLGNGIKNCMKRLGTGHKLPIGDGSDIFKRK